MMLKHRAPKIFPTEGINNFTIKFPAYIKRTIPIDVIIENKRIIDLPKYILFSP
jgi:hypothetical protein